MLKEAIADAKAVRETALKNAKIALEEAFAPRIKSMLSAKLAEELEDDENLDHPETEDHSEPEQSTEPGMEHQEPSDEHTEPGMEDDYSDDTNDDDLDLDEILRELDGDTDDEHTEPEMNPAPSVPSTEPAAEPTSPEHTDENPDDEINIDEILNSINEEDTMEDDEPEVTGKSDEELEEAYNVIRFLKGKINEVNLLNAKLLYSNKLFRNFNLNEGQKMKVIENFDRTKNVREVKLVYSTLCEGFKMPTNKTKLVKESIASKPVGSTKPANKPNIISEGTDLIARFQKLAGIKK